VCSSTCCSSQCLLHIPRSTLRLLNIPRYCAYHRFPICNLSCCFLKSQHLIVCLASVNNLHFFQGAVILFVLRASFPGVVVPFVLHVLLLSFTPFHTHTLSRALLFIFSRACSLVVQLFDTFLTCWWFVRFSFLLSWFSVSLKLGGRTVKAASPSSPTCILVPELPLEVHSRT